MNISFMAVNTLFDDSRSDIIALFKTFEENRKIISKRIGTGQHDSLALAKDYTRGYGRTQQDVLIPAFIAAYTKQSASSIGLDIFKTIPRPNWRVSYNGLSKVGFFQDIFQSFSITHGYKATLSLNRFNTGLDYLTETSPIPDPSAKPEDRDTLNPLNGNFYARLEIPEIVIQEGFAPLLAVNAVLKNGMQFNFDYKRSRTLAMSFVSNQLSETRVKEITMGFGYLLRNLDIGFLMGSNKSRGRKKPEQQQTPPPAQQGGGRPGTGQLQNKDLDIQFNFSLRDDVTYNHLLDQGIIEPTRGNFALTLSPSAEYKINRRLSLRAFIDYRRNVPKTSAGFPRTDTQGGIVVRFQLN
jgi:cell surface protein SprA